MKKTYTIFILLLCSIHNTIISADKADDAEKYRRKSELNDLAAEITADRAEHALKKIDDAQYLTEKEKAERAAAATRAILTNEEADPNNWEQGSYIDRNGQKRDCERNTLNHKLLRRATLGLISRNQGQSWIKEKKKNHAQK